MKLNAFNRDNNDRNHVNAFWVYDDTQLEDEAKEGSIPIYDFVAHDPNPNIYDNIILDMESEMKYSVKIG